MGLARMRLLVVAVLAGLIPGLAHADTRENCAAAWRNMPSADKGPMTREDWFAKCLKPTYQVGEYGAPSYAMAVCKDGHFSRRQKASHRCSHHGGIAVLF